MNDKEIIENAIISNSHLQAHIVSLEELVKIVRDDQRERDNKTVKNFMDTMNEEHIRQLKLEKEKIIKLMKSDRWRNKFYPQDLDIMIEELQEGDSIDDEQKRS